MLDLRQAPEYARYMQNIGWVAERIESVNYFVKKFPLIGSLIKIQRPQKIDFNQINNLTKKYRTHRIVVEPRTLSDGQRLIEMGFTISKSPFLPSKTIHINLTKSDRQLLKEMHYKTRYNIKKSRSLHLTSCLSNDIVEFANFWQSCALKQRGMFLSQKKEIVEIYKAFGKKAHLILIRQNKEILSEILLLRTKDMAYYMYAAASNSGKKLFAPTLAVWESIKLAKKQKCKVFDFEGIYDVRFPLKSWLGFTRFKKSFGGHDIDYPGAFQRLMLPLFR